MQLLEISGIWKGYYELGKSYPKNLQGKRTDFVLNIKETNGEFTGECIDIVHDNKDNTTSQIKGFVDEDLISFIKQYSFHLLIDKEGKRVIDYDEKHPEIEYTGYYDYESKKISGEWNMVTKNLVTQYDYSLMKLLIGISPDDEIEANIRIREYFNSGKWEMQKEE